MKYWPDLNAVVLGRSNSPVPDTFAEIIWKWVYRVTGKPLVIQIPIRLLGDVVVVIANGDPFARMFLLVLRSGMVVTVKFPPGEIYKGDSNVTRTAGCVAFGVGADVPCASGTRTETRSSAPSFPI